LCPHRAWGLVGFVVLIDEIAPEPVFDTNIVTVKPPEGLKCYCRMIPPAENTSNGFSFDSVERQWYDGCCNTIRAEMAEASVPTSIEGHQRIGMTWALAIFSMWRFSCFLKEVMIWNCRQYMPYMRMAD
jgi:hypothetical protein